MNLPEGITAIGTEAFANCPKLEEINIPESTELISQKAFKGCSALKAMTVPDNCKFGTWALEESGLESFIFPNRSKQNYVAEGLFRNCKNLKSVQLSEGIETICESAFAGCAGLRSVNIPRSLKVVKGGAFNNCESLRSLSFGPNVTFDERCFENMTGRIRLYPSPKIRFGMLDGFKGEYEFPEDCNPEYLQYRFEKEMRFAGKYASADGRCIIIDGKLYIATLMDYDKLQYNFPNGIVKVMERSIIIKSYNNRNATNIRFLFFANGLEEMCGRAVYDNWYYDDGVHRGWYPVMRFPKSFKRFTGDDVLHSNVGWCAVFESLVPPELGTYHIFDNEFYNGNNIPCRILVPKESLDAYRAVWTQEASRIQVGDLSKFVGWETYD